jgi:gamma-glutamylcyclotransferase (GGCT)/AIG2-like uncharacterized protein YtfP
MANFVYVKDNEIVEYYDVLPKSWKNISGLNLLAEDVPALNELGWYPVIHEDETHNPDTSYLSGYTYEIETEYVRQIPIIIDYTEEELQQRLEQDKSNFFIYIRNVRNEKLKDSDWTQVLDIQYHRDEIWIENWRNYRQALRDLPETYADTGNFDIGSIVWPEEPQDTIQADEI